MANKSYDSIVLFSGGLDSTTCLFLEKSRGYKPLAVSFHYNQRHAVELQRAAEIASDAGVDRIELKIDFSPVATSALTNQTISVPKGGKDLDRTDLIPITYVPARNLIFLSYAAAIAESENASRIVIGVNALDYSGYPDCRPDFIASFRETANLATARGRAGSPVEIDTPLISMSKRDILRMAESLGVPVTKTWSCYDPDAKGNPCGQCDSCILRDRALNPE